MNKGYFNLFILLISLVVMLMSFGSVIAVQTTPSCCTNQNNQNNYCLLGGYLDGTYPDRIDCCSGNQACQQNNFVNNRDCDATLCPNLGTGLQRGCCIDECKDGFQNECANLAPSNFKTSQCSATFECGEGCCRCKEGNNVIAAVNYKTRTQCQNECSATFKTNDFVFDLDVNNCEVDTYRPVTYIVSGRVTSSDNGQNLAGVDVVIVDVGSALTDSNGEYTIRNVPEGTYSISVRKSGYQPYFF